MNDNRPLIFYIDDEPHNLTVFEASLSDKWRVQVFDDPVKALSALKGSNPAVIVSDQRMPGMTGVQFLEVAKEIVPDTIRIIVTGYSDEDLVVQAVRKAAVYDYIKKPWDSENLEVSLQKAITHYETNKKNKDLLLELQKKELELTTLNNDLKHTATQLELSVMKERSLRQELECWAPPMLLWALQKEEQFPTTRDLIGISFDIIGSSKIHNVTVKGRSIRPLIIQAFTECILRHGGWRESHSGDAAYGHFGALHAVEAPADAALSAAREFRVALRSLSKASGHPIEAGISLHFCKNVLIDLHTVQLNTPKGAVTQKSFDTSSPDIDILHRIEKIVHKLQGTNIVMTEEFKKLVSTPIDPIRDIGRHNVAGYSNQLHLFIIPSDLVKENEADLAKLLNAA